MGCRLCDSKVENMQHIVENHVMNFKNLPKEIRFTFNSVIEDEKVNKKRKRIVRPTNNFSPDEAEILARLFDGVKEPHLKARKLTKSDNVKSTQKNSKTKELKVDKSVKKKRGRPKKQAQVENKNSQSQIPEYFQANPHKRVKVIHNGGTDPKGETLTQGSISEASH